MPGLTTFFSIISLLTGLASIVAAVRAWLRRNLPGMQIFPLITLGVVLWSLTSSIQAYTASTLPGPVWAIIRVLSSGLLPVAWLAFVLEYCGNEFSTGTSLLTAEPGSRPRSDRQSNRQWIILGAALLVSLLLASINYPRNLPLTEFNDPGYSILRWLHTAFVVLLLFIGARQLLMHLQRTPVLYKRQTRNRMVGILSPMIICTLEITGLQPFELFPLTPLTFTLWQWGFLLSTSHGSYTEVLNLARHALLEHIGSSLFILNDKGSILDLNPIAQQIAAEPREKVVHYSFTELFPEMRHLLTQAQSGDPAQGEVTLGNGKDKRCFTVNISMLHTHSGKTGGYLVEMHDVTPRKQAENALQESEERYELVINNMQEGLVVQNAFGIITACNANAERILGISSDQLKGRTVTDPRWNYVHEDGSVFPGEEHPATLALHTGLAQSDVIMGIHLRDGSVHWVSVSAQPLRRNDQSAPYAVISTFVDITENRSTVQNLQDRENRFRELLEFAPVAIVISGEQGKIRLVNARAEELLGYGRSELIGQSIEMLVPERFRQAHVGYRNGFIADNSSRPLDGIHLMSSYIKSNGDQPPEDEQAEPRELQIFVRRSDGSEFPADIGLNMIQTEDGPWVMSYLIDITERKQAADTLHQANEQLKYSLVEVEHHNHVLTLLNEMSDMLQSCSTGKEAHYVVASYAEKLFPGCSGALYLCPSSQEPFEAAIAWGESPPTEAMFTSGMCWGLRRGRAHMANITGNGLDCQHVSSQTLLTCSGYLCVPMLAQGEAIGVFHLRWNNASCKQTVQPLASTVAEHITISLANLALRDDLRMQSIRDPLTGLFNRRYMEDMFEREMRRAVRNQSALGVLLLDIDHFKDFNDTYGHAAGDVVLKTIGGHLLDNLRGEDIICRYGGEEFVIVLPDSTLAESQKVAEKLRRNIHRIRLKHLGQSLREISISVGVAAYPEHGRNTEKLIQAADQALYQAKEAGRDCVQLAV